MKFNAVAKKKIIIILFSLVFLVGCQENIVVKKMVVKSEFYNRNGYFIGNNKVELKINLPEDLKNLSYSWSADGGEFISQDNNQVLYLTPRIPGDYNIKVIIKDNKGHQVIQQFAFSVKGDYPKPVNLNKLTSNSVEGGVKINWSPYLGEDFYAYKIFRSNNNYIDDNFEVVTTIYNKQKSDYIDYNISDDQVYTYQVVVINDIGYFSLSNEQVIRTWQQGIQEINIGGNLTDIEIDIRNFKAYISNISQKKLIVFDTINQVLVDEIKLDYNAKKLVLNEEENLLFYFTPGNNYLGIIDLNTSRKRVFNFSNSIRDVLSNNGKVYLAVGAEDNLLEFNLEEEIINKFTLKAAEKLIDISSLELLDNNYFLIEDQYGNLFIYNPNNLDNFHNTLDLDGFAVKKATSITINGQHRLYLMYNYPNPLKSIILDQNLKIEIVQNISNDIFLKDFVIDQERGLVILASASREIIILDLENFKIKNRIKLKEDFEKIALDTANQNIYLLTEKDKLGGNNIVILSYE